MGTDTGTGDGINSVPACALPVRDFFLFISSCDSRNTDYFPTTPGYEWTYDISRTLPEIHGPVRQKSIVRNLQIETVDAIPYYPKIYASGKKYFFVKSTDGISREAPGENSSNLIIGYPLNVGTEWSAASRLYLFDLPKKLNDNRGRISRDLILDYTITSLDDVVEVPAGHFSNCLRIDAVGFLDLPRRLMLGIRFIKIEQTEWYGPGVGLIKMTRKEYALPDLYPSEYTQVLTSFKQK